jgi:hypothetical protein
LGACARQSDQKCDDAEAAEFAHVRLLFELVVLTLACKAADQAAVTGNGDRRREPCAFTETRSVQPGTGRGSRSRYYATVKYILKVSIADQRRFLRAAKAQTALRNKKTGAAVGDATLRTRACRVF